MLSRDRRCEDVKLRVTGTRHNDFLPPVTENIPVKMRRAPSGDYGVGESPCGLNSADGVVVPVPFFDFAVVERLTA